MSGTTILDVPRGSLPQPRSSDARPDDLDVEWITYAPGKRREFDVACRQVEGGRVLLYCTSLPGALAEGMSFEHALLALREVLDAILDEYRKSGSPVPFHAVELESGDRLCASVAVDA